MFPCVFRTSGLLCVQIHPVRTRERGVAVLVPPCTREQGSAEEDTEGEESVVEGVDTTIDEGQVDVQAAGRVPTCVNVVSAI